MKLRNESAYRLLLPASRCRAFSRRWSTSSRRKGNCRKQHSNSFRCHARVVLVCVIPGTPAAILHSLELLGNRLCPKVICFYRELCDVLGSTASPGACF